jgi:YggT family protein
MFTQIALLLIKTAISFWVALFLFRWYCLFIKLNMTQRRVLPKSSHFDLACFVSAFLVQFAGVVLQSLLLAGDFSVSHALTLSVFELASAAISGMTGLLIVFALLSWISSNPEIQNFLDRLTRPVLSPVRKVIPPVAGIDISILVVLLMLQVINIVLANLRVWATSLA